MDAELCLIFFLDLFTLLFEARDQGLSTNPNSLPGAFSTSSARQIRHWVKMVKLTMIARVTDGLPLAEGLDDGRDQKDADFYKQQAKILFKNLSKGHYEASRMSIETGPYFFQYPNSMGGYFLSIPDRAFVYISFLDGILFRRHLTHCFLQVVSVEDPIQLEIVCMVKLVVVDNMTLSFVIYIIEGRVCYLTMCDRSYPKKLAFQYLEDLKNEFERVNGNQIETAARPYAFIKFDTFIQKTKKLYLDTRTQRNIAKLNDELYEVHQIMTRNVQEVLGVGEKLDQVSELSSRLTSESRIYADKAKDLNRQLQGLKKAFTTLPYFYWVYHVLVNVLWFRVQIKSQVEIWMRT
ncbi:hypothetical protein ZIOFF_048418 [Zingiber officinale]|uniref:25.3 kDa vesicle transport protein n=1 Tax=Zingiber officinale TaxID=94328 RepID=A0A8J5FWJ1_ZINOF|nr:hypothetical protein ZIOFF_048418 [Zingiber officinale]